MGWFFPIGYAVGTKTVKTEGGGSGGRWRARARRRDDHRAKWGGTEASRYGHSPLQINPCSKPAC